MDANIAVNWFNNNEMVADPKNFNLCPQPEIRVLKRKLPCWKSNNVFKHG